MQGVRQRVPETLPSSVGVIRRALIWISDLRASFRGKGVCTEEIGGWLRPMPGEAVGPVRQPLSAKEPSRRTRPDPCVAAPLPQRRWILRDGWAIALFCAAAALTMYPVLTAPGSRLMGWPDDNVQSVYVTGWVADALRTLHSPFVDPRLNYPGSLWLPASEAPFLSMVAVAPLTLLFNPTFGYNLILFMSAWLSGYFTYLWILRITGSRFGGVVAGLVFALTPYRVAHSYGHVNLTSTQFLPVFFWALDAALQGDSPSRRRLVALAAGTFLVGAMSQYYLLICLLAGFVYTILSAPKRPVFLRHGWKLALSAGFGAAVSALPYLAAAREHLYVPYRPEETRMWSASPFDFLVPSRLHPLWGRLSQRLYPQPYWIEFTLYVGTVALILAGIALLWRNNPHHRRIVVWLGVALFAVVMSLGTDLHLRGLPAQAEKPIWLPGYYLAQLPVFNLMRVHARFGVVAILFTALLAGIGAALLKGRFNWGWRTMTLCVVLIVIDLAPGRIETFVLKPRPVDQWLARQPGDFAVAFLPPGVENPLALYGSLFHQKRFPAFIHSNFHPQAFRDFAARTARFPALPAVAALREMKFRYAILHRSSFDGVHAAKWEAVVAALARSPDLKIVTELDGFVVAAVRPYHQP